VTEKPEAPKPEILDDGQANIWLIVVLLLFAVLMIVIFIGILIN